MSKFVVLVLRCCQYCTEKKYERNRNRPVEDRKTDGKLIKSLTQYATDDSLEGSESQKNRFLAPAPAVPKIDREVAEAAGKSVGLEPLPSNKILQDSENKSTNNVVKK